MSPDFCIASPCTADWDLMAGDARVRHCAECKLNVYNFAELTRAEIEQLVANREGRLCARMYRRADGTLITKDCPVGFQMKVRRISRIAGAALAGAMAASPATAQIADGHHSNSIQITSQTATVAVEVIDPSGAVIPNASIQLTNPAGIDIAEVRTDGSGRGELLRIAPGTYRMKISSHGFKTATQTLGLHSGDDLGVEVKLDIGEILEGGVMVFSTEQAEYTQMPLSRETIPLLPVGPENDLAPAPSWLHRLRQKLHL